MIAAVTAGSSGYLAGRGEKRAIQGEPMGQGEMVAKGEPRSAVAAKVAGASAPPRPPLSVSAVNATVPAALPSAPSLLGPTPPSSAASLPAAHVEPTRASSEGRPASQVAAVAPPPQVLPSIAEQLESIRRARARVQESDGKAALRELDAYEARSPRGTFEEEALALRVRALRLSGDGAGAARELANLASRFPASVHLAALSGPGGAL
jgi:hypothetical protein